jgi:hypothetical protein
MKNQESREIRGFGSQVEEKRKWDKKDHKFDVFRMKFIEIIIDKPVRTVYPKTGQIGLKLCTNNPYHFFNLFQNRRQTLVF